LSQTFLQNYDEFDKLKNALHTEMPFISESFVKIPYKYAPFPKNLMDEAVRVNEKFLNKWQGVIEDKFSNQEKEIFRAYQNKYFSNRELSSNLKESFFKKCNCKTKRQITDIIIQSIGHNIWRNHGMKLDYTDFLVNVFFSNHGNAFISFGVPSCNAGATLDSLGAIVGSTSSTTGYIRAAGLDSGSTSDCYDELAQDVNAAGGNYRLAAYDDSSGPNNLEAEAGSHSAATGVNVQSVTEWTLATATQFLAMQSDNNGNEHDTWAGTLYLDAQSYGAFPDPISASTDNAPNWGQISHS